MGRGSRKAARCSEAAGMHLANTTLRPLIVPSRGLARGYGSALAQYQRAFRRRDRLSPCLTPGSFGSLAPPKSSALPAEQPKDGIHQTVDVVLGCFNVYLQTRLFHGGRCNRANTGGFDPLWPREFHGEEVFDRR